MDSTASYSHELRDLIKTIKDRLSIQAQQIAKFGLYVPTHMSLEEKNDLLQLKEQLLRLFHTELDPILAQTPFEVSWLNYLYVTILGHSTPDPELQLTPVTLPLDRIRQIYTKLLGETEHGFKKFAQFIGGLRMRYPSLRPALDAWIKTISRTILPLSPTDFETNPDVGVIADDPTLLIKVERTDLDDVVDMQGFLWFNDQTVMSLPTDRQGYAFDALESGFVILYQQALKLLPDATRLQIDFFLDVERLQVTAHRWRVIQQLKRFDLLGRHHLVTLRSFERTFGIYGDAFDTHAIRWRHQWVKKWAELGNWQRQYYVLDSAVYETLYDDLTSEDDYVCVVECCEAPHQDRSVMIEASIPIGVWLESGCHPAERYQELQAYMQTMPNIFALPERVRKSRKRKEALGAGIILFWDDPTRRPYRLEDQNDNRRPPAAQSP